MPKTPKLKDFLVCWTIDVLAVTPEEAAKEALQIMRDPESSATVFTVSSPGEPPRRVDIAAGPLRVYRDLPQAYPVSIAQALIPRRPRDLHALAYALVCLNNDYGRGTVHLIDVEEKSVVRRVPVSQKGYFYEQRKFSLHGAAVRFAGHQRTMPIGAHE